MDNAASTNPMERRLTLRLLAYWEKLRGEHPMPTEYDVNPADLRELWQHCFMLRVIPGEPPQVEYTYQGSAIEAGYRHGLFEDVPGDVASPYIGRPTHGYLKVIATGKPYMEDGEFRTLRNEVARYRKCLLPLGEGEKVAGLLCGMRFRIFQR